MIFSYGFLEEGMTSAQAVFIDLDIPTDDPLGPAKKAVNSAAPGFRVFDGTDRTSWESDYIWLVCVNEEDGLRFDFAVTNDGEHELKVLWKGKELDDTASLRRLLAADPLWEIFNLRAVALIQGRIEEQLQIMHDSRRLLRERQDTAVKSHPQALATRLHVLELDLLERAYADLEEEVSMSKPVSGPVDSKFLLLTVSSQKLRLLGTETVQAYLGAKPYDSPAEDDFS